MNFNFGASRDRHFPAAVVAYRPRTVERILSAGALSAVLGVVAMKCLGQLYVRQQSEDRMVARSPALVRSPR